MSDFVDRAGRVALRNALLKASKNYTIIQGDCGRMPWCGAKWQESSQTWERKQTTGCCALCAYFLADDDLQKAAKMPKAYPEQLMADAIGVDVDWLMSFTQGFDGEDQANNHKPAYRIGQALWRLFAGDEKEEVET